MRALLLGLATALLIGSAFPAAANTDPEPDPEDQDTGRGNAIDRLMLLHGVPLHFLPREYWMARYLASTIEGRILLYRYLVFRTLYWRPLVPGAGVGVTPAPEPDNEPAESILDQMDEADAQLPMVGEPGQRLQSLDAMGEIPTPPPVSILDQMDESPNPAANQATPPKLVEVPR
jgi:hypothetical protein